jgi:hypothetical protein
LKYKTQIIIWQDCTHTDDGSLASEEALEEPLMEMHTIGFVVAERDDCVILGGEYIPEQSRFRHITWIPKVNIIKRLRIKP